MPEWIAAIVVIGGVLIISLGLGWVAFTILEEFYKARTLKKFSEDFKASLKHSQPTWDEIKEIASTRGLTQSELPSTIRRYYREVITGREPELDEYKEQIRSYIETYKKSEPFEGLPSDVRIHLERLRENIPNEEHLLEPLISQIKDLLVINSKEKKTQKNLTVSSFFIGIVGIAFSVYTYFNSPLPEEGLLKKEQHIVQHANKNEETE